jgi:excisionase family DNA binding protein
MDRATLPDVLTLEEASDYLRLPVEAVLRQASQGNIPGRKIENNWRFLKTAIDDWLRSQSNRTILLHQAGADPYLLMMKSLLTYDEKFDVVSPLRKRQHP